MEDPGFKPRCSEQDTVLRGQINIHTQERGRLAGETVQVEVHLSFGLGGAV